jgi:hypothetical protein
MHISRSIDPLNTILNNKVFKQHTRITYNIRKYSYFHQQGYTTIKKSEQDHQVQVYSFIKYIIVLSPLRSIKYNS